ncbi:hypothetical protein [Corticibacter populi]|uniref:hypothetical protein n=1 Tax=Corticibacter populi TaxID=1550736 RepID=UPI00102BD2BF|nr:hypothetical protein [Corticibacter populi]RZS35811.1 hypothetical protein EV687_0890 [Corticibacter populi]
MSEQNTTQTDEPGILASQIALAWAQANGEHFQKYPALFAALAVQVAKTAQRELLEGGNDGGEHSDDH